MPRSVIENPRGKPSVPPLQKPTLSFYNRRGAVDQLDGVNVLNSKRKSMFLMTIPDGSMPLVADYLVARYFENPDGPGWVAQYKIVWSRREPETRDRDFMASIGYPLEPSNFLDAPATLFHLGVFPTITAAERALREDIALRFTVTSSWPDVLWLLSPT